MSLFSIIKNSKIAKSAVLAAGLSLGMLTFAQPAQARGSDFQKIVDIIESNASPRKVSEQGLKGTPGFHLISKYNNYVLKTSHKGKNVTYNLKKLGIEFWSQKCKDVSPHPNFNNRGTLVQYVLNIEYGGFRNKVTLTDKGVDGSIEHGSMRNNEYRECITALFKKYKVKSSRLKYVRGKDAEFIRKKAAHNERSRKRMNSMRGYNRNNYNRAPIPFKPRSGPNKVWRR
ncbi:MAG: hypothetical protein U9R08_03785 [Nanoarchaeota archaeon]|nr:hypothetical protein [Nanoarchaeota archaeon]